jgi:hypothetical protein
MFVISGSRIRSWLRHRDSLLMLKFHTETSYINLIFHGFRLSALKTFDGEDKYYIFKVFVVNKCSVKNSYHCTFVYFYFAQRFMQIERLVFQNLVPVSVITCSERLLTCQHNYLKRLEQFPPNGDSVLT